MIRTLLFTLATLAACATPPKPEPEPEPEPEPLNLGQPVAVKAQFAPGDAPDGCVPTAPTTELRGTIRVLPFGKGTDGALLDDGRDEWILSYDAEDGVFEDFNDYEVLIRGRPCDKKMQAVKGPHFEVKSIRMIEP